ncbi:MAG: hypothetical protein DK306_002023, partial [Chloroflexi bacterium]
MLWKNRLVVSVAAAGAISAAAFRGIAAAAATNATATTDSASSVAVVERVERDAAPAQFSPARTGDLQTVQLNEDG